jgi:hypothetical protein
MAIKSVASEELDLNLSATSTVFVVTDARNDANNNQVIALTTDSSVDESNIQSTASSQDFPATSNTSSVPAQAAIVNKIEPPITVVSQQITNGAAVYAHQPISASPVHSTGSGVQSHSGSNTDGQLSCTIEYLAQLIKDTKQLQTLPNVFIHVERLLEEGTYLVRNWFGFFYSSQR